MCCMPALNFHHVPAQVGNLTTDIAYWGPPEALTSDKHKRPVYTVNTASGASDLAGELCLTSEASSRQCIFQQHTALR